MREIELTQGKIALIDDEDFDDLKRFKWQANKAGNAFYATRTVRFGACNKFHLQMHKAILEAPDGMDIDHINHNGLDNRKENLRVCSHAQNCQNQKLHRNSMSGHKGVTWNKRDENWRARIMINGIAKHLGIHVSKEEAAQAYNRAAIKLHGEFALTNVTRR